MFRSFLTGTALFLLLPLFASASEALQFSDVWSPEAPPSARVMAGYFKVTNPGEKEILIEEVTSPQFKTIEMHRTVHEGGMAKMMWQPHIHVPAGKTVVLEPGGKHLMMMRPKARLQQGDIITLYISLSNGQRQTIKATVRRTDVDQHQHQHH